MKYYLLGIALLAALCGCKSPLDVDASRRTEYPDRNGTKAFRFEPSKIDLGYAHPGDTVKFSFKVINVGSTKFDIEYMEWLYYKFLNDLTEFGGSFSLEPKGSTSSERTINCSFTNVQTGRYRDTLRINNYLVPQLELVASVPEIYMKDVVFRNAEGSGPFFENIYIFNRSSRTVILKAAQLPLNSPFSVTNTLPLELPANSSAPLFLSVAFAPPSPGVYSQTLKITLEGADGLIVDDEAVITAYAQ